MTKAPAWRRIPEAQRRGDLVEAALDVIAQSGLQGATFREIAKQAGVAPGLIAHHFESKEILLQEAYRRVVSVLTFTDEEEAGSAAENLRRFIVANLTEPVSNNRNLALWSAFISQVSHNPTLAGIHCEGYLAFRNKLQRLIVAFLAARGKEIDETRAHRLAVAISALMDGLWLEGRLAGGLFEENELVTVALSSVEALTGESFAPPGEGENDMPARMSDGE
ncbi:TetR family transcriptional regulator C-terminal domain-containing protein [Pseudomonas sp. GX19020]|uniref:TetR family transcriptional regulator C-terminal domain-containing protein n=1 Tax=Pseudomonas sp. GX19020 TaxID=2942277 RepID=UPI002019C5BE|nr:TetR family transcriptional regulator C-terminal domain-containing protein [Pseudomonas sp. GX19020]